jgi:hypothetical protein
MTDIQPMPVKKEETQAERDARRAKDMTAAQAQESREITTCLPERTLVEVKAELKEALKDQKRIVKEGKEIRDRIERLRTEKQTLKAKGEQK